MNKQLYIGSFILLLIASSCLLSVAQETGSPWKRILDFRTLEIGEVYDITSDTSNLLWIASSTGLYNFDGYSFEQLSSFEVRSLLIEKTKRRLWLGGNQGIYSLDLVSKEMVSVGLEKKLISSSEFYFKDLFEDKNHNIWATSYNGLYLCRPDSCTNFLIEEEALLVQEDPYLNRLNRIGKHDHPDSIYIAALKGVYTFNIKTYKFNDTNLTNDIVNDLLNYKDKLFIAKYEDIIEVHSKLNSSIDSISIPKGGIVNKIHYDQKKLWISAENGLFSFTDTLSHFDDAAEPLYSDRKPKCNTLYRDRLGHYWAGYENGLYLWDPLRNLISTRATSKIFSQPKAQIYDLNESSDGSLLINSSTNKVNVYNAISGETNSQFNEFEDVIIIHDSLWAFVKNGQLLGYNPSSKVFNQILDPKAFREADFKSYLSHLFDSRNNALIIGRQWGRGITCINLENGKFKRYNQSELFNNENLTSTGFDYLLTDQKNNLYFTSGKGLGQLNLKTDKATLIKNTKETACTGIAKDSNGRIYAVFKEDGIHLLSPELKKIELSIDNLETILFDDEQLWATSPLGLLNINLDNRNFYTLGSDNGLPKNNLFGAKLKKGRSNSIFIYSDEWLAYLDKTKLKALEQFNTKPTIKNKNGQVFNFSSFNFKPKGMNRFEYQVKKGNDWILANKLNEVNFDNSAPGTYDFQVRSSFAQKPWQYSDVSKIHIPYPWWMRWYSIAIAIFTASFLIYFYNRQVRKQEQLKSELKTLQMQSLRSQMNPHFIFNALNSIKHFILGNDKFVASEYLSNFSMLIRKILLHSESETISLSEEIETLKLYLEMEQRRFDQKFVYKINVDSEIDTDLTSIPPLILQPYVENAIWHGLLHKESEGLLQINIKRDDKFINYEIVDNGIGRVKAAEIKTKSALKKKSLGMQITKDRLLASKINADVAVVDLQNGTKVILKIPER